MGVFKWLRRDRLSLSGRRSNEDDIPRGSTESVDVPEDIGTIRTPEYKRSLAEFQARRLSGQRDALQTPQNKPRRKSARHSLPVSCTKCSNDIADVSFNYEKSSVRNYNKSKARRNSNDDCIPNIQFLFSNQQVFMPGNIFTKTSYSEMHHSKHSASSSDKSRDRSLKNQQIDFDVEDDTPESPPLYFKNNCLPFDISDFINEKDDSVTELNNYKYRVEAERDVEVKEMESPSKKSGSSGRSKSSDAKLEEVMSELMHFDEWADEQLRMQSICTNNSDESKSDASQYGIQIVSSVDIEVRREVDAAEWPRGWVDGHWGAVPIQVRKLENATLEQLKKKQCMEVNLLRKFRHPNIILLMGVSSDVEGKIRLICERCVSTLYNILHVQNNVLSIQTSVSYAADIASALVFLQMQGYIHTDVSSHVVAITEANVAKLADLAGCISYASADKPVKNQEYDKDGYFGLEDGKYSSSDCQPLISDQSPRTVRKPYKQCRDSDTFRWHAPETFQPGEDGAVLVCPRTDVYSLALVLWECCNASVPWKTLSYAKLSELYVTWKTGIRLSHGTYPGCLLELLEGALCLDRQQRISLERFANGLKSVKSKMSDMEEILIPLRLNAKRSGFSSNWDKNSISDLECRTSKTSVHRQSIRHSTSESSHQDENSVDEAIHEVFKSKAFEEKNTKSSSDILGLEEPLKVQYKFLPTKEISLHSTPLTKKKVTLREIGTPGEQLYKSDSTEYCTILSPNVRTFDLTDGDERPSAKLTSCFTPKSYKSLQIQIPSVEKIDDLKSVASAKEERQYKFDVKGYSLPNTPIARNNKLRKNAWLSGEELKKNGSVELKIIEDSDRAEQPSVKSTQQDCPKTTACSDKENKSTSSEQSQQSGTSGVEQYKCDENAVFPLASSTLERLRSNSWSCRTEEPVTGVEVKPLVAIHERWISEASGKTGRGFATPDGHKHTGPLVKPASHSVEAHTAVPLSRKHRLRSSLNTLSNNCLSARKNSLSEQFSQARDRIARSISFSRDPEHREAGWTREHKCLSDVNAITPQLSVDNEDDRRTVNAATNTSLDDFVKQLIKKEFHELFNQTMGSRYSEECIAKGTSNVVDTLVAESRAEEKISKVKINGNSKPLIEIRFNKGGEKDLHVMDSCVNVTICEKGKKQSERLSLGDEVSGSLKRSQAFSSLHEARSTEDLYIDDDITHMEETIGDMKLIPLHNSLHEVLCEKADDCCLIKIKEENGCDRVYFMTENSKDDIDGAVKEPKDKVFIKRSISLIEQRIERMYPKERRDKDKAANDVENSRKIKPRLYKVKDTNRRRSEKNEAENWREMKRDVINIEQIENYDSSDESVKGQDIDEFEAIEKSVEEDFASINTSCGPLEKISEENLSDNQNFDKSHESGLFRAELRETQSCVNFQ